MAAHTTSDSLHQDANNIFVAIQAISCNSFVYLNHTAIINQTTISTVQLDTGSVCVGDQQIETSVSETVSAYIDLPLEAICQDQNYTGDYRTATIIYRNQKLFGKENISESGTEPSPCDKRQYSQSQYTTTMDVVPSKYFAPGEVPMERMNLSKPVAFGMKVKNHSKVSLFR